MSGRFWPHRLGKPSIPRRSPDPARLDRPRTVPWAFPRTLRRRWPWSGRDTSCCAVSEQDGGKEYPAAQHTDTTDSETWDRADEFTFGVAHVPLGLYASTLRRNRNATLAQQGRSRRKTPTEEKDSSTA